MIDSRLEEIQRSRSQEQRLDIREDDTLAVSIGEDGDAQLVDATVLNADKKQHEEEEHEEENSEQHEEHRRSFHRGR